MGWKLALVGQVGSCPGRTADKAAVAGARRKQSAQKNCSQNQTSDTCSSKAEVHRWSLRVHKGASGPLLFRFEL